MVEAFRHTPGAGLGAPTASLFGEICYKSLCIALSCVELIIQILDVGRC
jgi:hypothetical protein